MGRRALVGLVLAPLLALALASVAAADVGLIVRRASAPPGTLMTVWGGCRLPVYLVPQSIARRWGLSWFALPVARPPTGRPFRLLGRTSCTGRMHYVGDYPDGDWSSWSGRLRFRVPRVRPGRYELVVYCASCRRGSGGTLVVNNWLWRGSKRVGPAALTISRAAP
jgi:hypothetical protein